MFLYVGDDDASDDVFSPTQRAATHEMRRTKAELKEQKGFHGETLARVPPCLPWARLLPSIPIAPMRRPKRGDGKKGIVPRFLWCVASPDSSWRI